MTASSFLLFFRYRGHAFSFWVKIVAGLRYADSLQLIVKLKTDVCRSFPTNRNACKLEKGLWRTLISFILRPFTRTASFHSHLAKLSIPRNFLSKRDAALRWQRLATLTGGSGDVQHLNANRHAHTCDDLSGRHHAGPQPLPLPKRLRRNSVATENQILAWL